jgi:hypothetical protein
VPLPVHTVPAATHQVIHDDPTGRGRIELPTFRFSGGFAGPDGSITGCPSGLYDAAVPLGVHVQCHASTAVVSTALASSIVPTVCWFVSVASVSLACLKLDILRV